MGKSFPTLSKSISRRSFLNTTLSTAVCGFGALAAGQTILSANEPAAQKVTYGLHHQASAKRVIFLFMHGGVSQMDTFDYKPRLVTDHGKPLPFDLPGLIRPDRLGQIFAPKSKFQQHGKCGQWVSELLPHLATQVDRMCFIKSLHTEGEAHGQAVINLHTGTAAFVRPSIGSWLAYGVGSENKNLPSFMSLDYPTMHGGVRLYGNAFLPAHHQGTQVQMLPGQEPHIKFLSDGPLTPQRQRQQLDSIQALNRTHLEELKEDARVSGIIESYELAYRMQGVAPDVLDLSSESTETKELYGIGQGITDDFGRRCLVARRLAESGVRFIQVASGYHWDHHGNIEKDLPQSCAKTDKPMAGLLTDLAQRGLLEDTLVVCVGEFGRTPVAQIDRGQPGRDHNPHGNTMWLAGGGVKPGFSLGQTDEFGYLAIEDKVHMHDLHATILHMMGIDHERLTYRYAGRDFRLTDVYGRVVREILRQNS